MVKICKKEVFTRLLLPQRLNWEENMNLEDFISDIRNQVSVIIETTQIISNKQFCSEIQNYCDLISNQSYNILETIDRFYDLK